MNLRIRYLARRNRKFLAELLFRCKGSESRGAGGETVMTDKQLLLFSFDEIYDFGHARTEVLNFPKSPKSYQSLNGATSGSRGPREEVKKRKIIQI